MLSQHEPAQETRSFLLPFSYRNGWSLWLATLVCGLSFAGCGANTLKSGKARDEAMKANRGPETFPAADEDYFHGMDYGITKDPNALAAKLNPFVPGITPATALDAAVKGRNTWIVWTGGNDRFWDELSRRSVGALDFLKTLSNHSSLPYSRSNRWEYLGLVNEPCFEKPTEPRADRYGLWLDVRSPDCPPDPFENEEKYPGVRIGARGKNIPVGSYYGYATGIVGLRLFPNPEFDSKAEKKWDAAAYYTNPDYYDRSDLVKPYRVGMSCAFCHVGPNPSRPPADPERPKWENLNSNPGAQYLWIDRIFVWRPDEKNYLLQMFHSSRPGTVDTSFISNDNINNPRTMNSVYQLGPRMQMARKWGQETIAGDERNNAQLNDVFTDGPLTEFFHQPDTVWTPRVLKDGSDSVGALGALNRVYLNIGLFSEEWLLHFAPLLGGRVTPIRIEDARKNSTYWLATEKQTPNTGLFFLASSPPDYLKEAPGGDAYLTKDAAQLAQGKRLFAERCARCHSSKLPDRAYTFFPNGCVGPGYLKCWEDYWEFTKTSDFKTEMTQIVLQDDFLKDNFLSTDQRVPVTLLETCACSPLATNALRGNIWDNFSSNSYKELPSVGEVTIHHPLTGEPYEYKMPGGGRGYTRPASLVSLWSSAPFLLNNSMGRFYWSGSVEDRMKSFDDGIQKMLWPEKRDGERQYVTASGKMVPGVIDRTRTMSSLRVARGYLPQILRPFFKEDIEIGPIPERTPVNLLANIDSTASGLKLFGIFAKLKRALRSLPDNPTNEQAIEAFKGSVDELLEVNKCPDFVINRGHYFGTDYFSEEPGLSDEEKRALIEFLKTF